MLDFIEMHECKMDAKGRILLPASLKKQLIAASPEGFVLKRSVMNQCLDLYTLPEWKKELKRINKLNRFKKRHDIFIRRFLSGAKRIEPDATGRINIAKDLLVFSELTKNVVIAPLLDRLEIWDKNLYEKSINDPDIDIGELTEEVMGGLEFDETEEDFS